MKIYWVVKTSAISHIKEYIKFISFTNRTWVKVNINYQNYSYPEIIFNQEIILKKGRNAFSQMIIGWEALGLVTKRNDGYYSLCFLKEIEEIVEYSKIFLLKKNDNPRVNNYRISKLINILVNSETISFKDLIGMNYQQKRGKLTYEKILNEISWYDKYISRDMIFLSKAKEKIC